MKRVLVILEPPVNYHRPESEFRENLERLAEIASELTEGTKVIVLSIGDVVNATTKKVLDILKIDETGVTKQDAGVPPEEIFKMHLQGFQYGAEMPKTIIIVSNNARLVDQLAKKVNNEQSVGGRIPGLQAGFYILRIGALRTKEHSSFVTSFDEKITHPELKGVEKNEAVPA